MCISLDLHLLWSYAHISIYSEGYVNEISLNTCYFLCFYFLRKRYLYSRGITINSTNVNAYETFLLFDKVDTFLVK